MLNVRAGQGRLYHDRPPRVPIKSEPATGTCAPVATHEGGPCDDGDACTATDVCRAGQCAGSGLPDDSVGDWTFVSASPNRVSVKDIAPDGAGGLWALLYYTDTLSLGPTAGGGELQLDNDSTTWPEAYAVAHYSVDGTLTNLGRVARSTPRGAQFRPRGQIAAAGDGGFTIAWQVLSSQDQLGAGAASITLTDETLGLLDAVVAHYTPAGTYSWHRVARNALPTRLDSGPTGTALLTVVHSSDEPLTLEVPGQATTVISEAGISVVEYDVAGTLVSAKRVLNRADYGFGFCSVTVEGRVLCWGLFQSGSPTGGSPAVGLELASGAGGSLYTQGHNDGFIALDASAGGASWLRGVDTAGWDVTQSCVVVDDRVACLAVVGLELSADDDATAVVYGSFGALHGFPPIHTRAKPAAVLLTLFDLDGQLVAGVRHEIVEYHPPLQHLVATDSSLFAYGSGRTGDRWWGSAPLPTSTEAWSGLVAEIDVDDGQLLWATIAGKSHGWIAPQLLAPTTSGPGLTFAGQIYGEYTIGAVSGDTDDKQLFLTRLNSAGGAACQ
ncbi:MAG: hypothetical protein CSA66_08170 [Proteobacteria bacterium]|nr:MAG: hypothetical protein CSA66_08170 [Pseudomonadota bacterium]